MIIHNVMSGSTPLPAQIGNRLCCGEQSLNAVNRVLSFLQPSLAGMGARERLLDIAAATPITSGAMVECHLGMPQRIDFSLRFMPEERELATACGFPATMLSNRNILWAEFDLGQGIEPSAGWFFGPGNPPCGPPLLRPSVEQWIEGIEIIGRSPLSAETRSRLKATLNCIPAHAWAGYLGLFPARAKDVVRVTVSGLRLHEIDGFLSLSGTPPGFLIAVPLAGLVGDLPVRMVVHLDAGKAVGEYIGLELAPRQQELWPALLNAVLSAVCLPQAVAQDLLAWPGLDPAHSLLRRLNHLKLVFSQGRIVKAKAYLYYGSFPQEKQP